MCDRGKIRGDSLYPMISPPGVSVSWKYSGQWARYWK